MNERCVFRADVVMSIRKTPLLGDIADKVDHRRRRVAMSLGALMVVLPASGCEFLASLFNDRPRRRGTAGGGNGGGNTGSSGGSGSGGGGGYGGGGY
jgi:uncharacterized membrane protein YgcG